MSKKKKAILIGGIVLVLLIGLLVVLQITKPKDTTSEEAMSNFENSIIKLIAEDNKSNLDYIKVKNPSGEYTIEKQGENVWSISELMDFAQLSDEYTTTIMMACNVTASGIVKKNCDDLSVYGLANPHASMEVKFNGKDAYKISVGDISTDGKIMYGCVTGERTVYSFPSSTFQDLFKSKYDYVDKLVTPGFASDQVADIPIVNEMTVTREDLDKPIKLVEYKEGELSKNAPAQANFYMNSPVTARINETSAEEWVFGNFGIQAEQVVKANPTAAELTEYGFDKPTSTMEIKYNKTSSFKVIVGKGILCKHKDGEDLTNHKHVITSYYAMREGINQVFEIAVENMCWLKLTPDDLISKILVLPNIVDIKDITVAFAGSDMLNRIELTSGPDVDKAEGMTAKVNGKDTDIAKVKQYIQLLQFTSVQGVSDKTTGGNPAVIITYNYRDGKKDKIVVTTESDASSLVILNDKNIFVGRMGFAEKLDKEIRNLIDNKNVDTEW